MENLNKLNSTKRLVINKTRITKVRTEIKGDGPDFPGGPETLMTSSSSRVSNII
ncbi:hypothetical protein HDF26_002852 [Pedobacter cryoconitis]|uniref:Uncharacterized protein n=1 Tax=Pedobacter cryoconitis TaxID=188932 RepID=A0A7W9DXS2_9SPHI|nr:hypothetical protein [Pedobacter cryoconitis]MBB6272395.1 hypothetical protein [Pedobacter cryoconitis]